MATWVKIGLLRLFPVMGGSSYGTFIFLLLQICHKSKRFSVKIAYATKQDYTYLKEHDHHVSADMLRMKIERQEILLLWEAKNPVGWLRFNYFWDEIPMMNMLFIAEEYRGKGLGKSLVAFWETEMLNRGYRWVLTSTLANEQAQHMYRRMGYRDCGGLLFPDEPLEIVLRKEIG